MERICDILRAAIQRPRSGPKTAARFNSRTIKFLRLAILSALVTAGGLNHPVRVAFSSHVIWSIFAIAVLLIDSSKLPETALRLDDTQRRISAALSGGTHARPKLSQRFTMSPIQTRFLRSNRA